MSPPVKITLINERLVPFSTRNLTISPGQAISIGRSSKDDSKNLPEAEGNAFFDCPVMSRNHATLTMVTWPTLSIMLTDTSSMHGTCINGTKVVPNEPFELRDGDRLQFGASVSRGEAVHQSVTVQVFIAKANNHFRVPSDTDSDCASVVEVEEFKSQGNIEIPSSASPPHLNQAGHGTECPATSSRNVVVIKDDQPHSTPSVIVVEDDDDDEDCHAIQQPVQTVDFLANSAVGKSASYKSPSPVSEMARCYGEELQHNDSDPGLSDDADVDSQYDLSSAHCSLDDTENPGDDDDVPDANLMSRNPFSPRMESDWDDASVGEEDFDPDMPDYSDCEKISHPKPATMDYIDPEVSNHVFRPTPAQLYVAPGPSTGFMPRAMAPYAPTLPPLAPVVPSYSIYAPPTGNATAALTPSVIPSAYSVPFTNGSFRPKGFADETMNLHQQPDYAGVQDDYVPRLRSPEEVEALCKEWRAGIDFERKMAKAGPDYVPRLRDAKEVDALCREYRADQDAAKKSCSSTPTVSVKNRLAIDNLINDASRQTVKQTATAGKKRKADAIDEQPTMQQHASVATTKSSNAGVSAASVDEATTVNVPSSAAEAPAAKKMKTDTPRPAKRARTQLALTAAAGAIGGCIATFGFLISPLAERLIQA